MHGDPSWTNPESRSWSTSLQSPQWWRKNSFRKSLHLFCILVIILRKKKKSNSLPKISFKIFYRHTKISIYILNNNGNLAVRQYRTKVSSFKKPSNSLKKKIIKAYYITLRQNRSTKLSNDFNSSHACNHAVTHAPTALSAIHPKVLAFKVYLHHNYIWNARYFWRHPIP